MFAIELQTINNSLFYLTFLPYVGYVFNQISGNF